MGYTLWVYMWLPGVRSDVVVGIICGVLSNDKSPSYNLVPSVPQSGGGETQRDLCMCPEQRTAASAGTPPHPAHSHACCRVINSTVGGHSPRRYSHHPGA